MTAQPQVREALAIGIAGRLPVALFGGPGVGKTSMVEQLGAAHGMHVEVIVLAQSEPTDLTGVPYVDDTGSTRSAVPDWVHRVNQSSPSLVFLDEFTQASPLHQGVCNDIIQSRRVAGVALAEHVHFVAGYNPPEVCGGFDLSMPTRNRFIHIEVNPDPDAVAEGLLLGWPEAPHIDFVDLERHVRHWKTTVAAFVKARPGVLEPPSPTATGPFATPRSLELAALAAAYADAARRSADVRNLLIQGAIGAGAGLELSNYAAELDLPDPARALADPDGVTLPERPDRAWAALQSIADHAVRRGDLVSWRAAWRLAGRVAYTSGADVAAMAARQLVVHQPPGATPPDEVAVFRDLLAA
jgi:MoxR-like ATPase